MGNERYKIGLEKFMEYTKGDSTSFTPNNEILEPLSDIAPDLRKLIIEFAYGDIYSRPNLNNQERSMITIASLVTQGTQSQIETHIKRALNVGLSPKKIVESIMQLIPYTGFPSVQNALITTQKVLKQRKLI